METPIATPPVAPPTPLSFSSPAPAPGVTASAPAPSAGGGPSFTPSVAEIAAQIEVLAKHSGDHTDMMVYLDQGITAIQKAIAALNPMQNADAIQTLTSRLNAVQSTLEDLDTPQNAEALGVIVDALTKPGHRTTEFWLALLGAVGTLSLAAGGVIPGESAGYITLAGTVLYGFSRWALKSKLADLAQQTLPLLAILLCLNGLTGCAWTAAHQTQIDSTLAVVGNRALVVAENVLISAATSEADSNFKADYLDSIASGLRANETTIVSSDDVSKIVSIWSPNDGAAWQSLGVGVAQVADQALTAANKPQAAAVVEQIAAGLNTAAKNARANAAAGEGVPLGPLTSSTDAALNTTETK